MRRERSSISNKEEWSSGDGEVSDGIWSSMNVGRWVCLFRSGARERKYTRVRSSAAWGVYKRHIHRTRFTPSRIGEGRNLSRYRSIHGNTRVGSINHGNRWWWVFSPKQTMMPLWESLRRVIRYFLSAEASLGPSLLCCAIGYLGYVQYSK